jgi:hypothetical protein
MVLDDPNIEPKKVYLFAAISAALEPIVFTDLRILWE